VPEISARKGNATAKELDDLIASWDVTEDQLMEEHKAIRRAFCEKKRSAARLRGDRHVWRESTRVSP
jgi:hypothetical protein